MQKKAGFSLVEIMIAVIIVGILVAIAIPNYSRSFERAKSAQAVQILKTLRSAELAYFSEYQGFFNNLAAMEDFVGGNFYSDDSNPDWDFAITNATGSQLSLTATRLRGPHAAAGNTTMTLNDNITTNDNELWGGSYPKDDAGNF